MSLENNKYKIIFLVDVSLLSRQNKDDQNVDSTINLIGASALKLLLHFATRVKDENKQLEWGFKFYNVHNPRYNHRNIFRDLNVKEFEEFENDLQQLLEDDFNHLQSTPSCSNPNLSRKNSFTGSRSIHAGCDRSDTLGTQLKHVICDFQWQGPDICSPVKLNRRRFSMLPQAPVAETLNAVFLFSDCPHSISDITSFATCDETVTPQDFLAEFLPKSVYQQFCVVKGLRLFWIDTDVLQKENADVSNLHGVVLVNEALTKVGGCVIPASILVQNGSQASANILHALSGSCSSSAPLLPVASIVQYYTTQRTPASSLPSVPVSATFYAGQHHFGKSAPFFSVELQPVIQARTGASPKDTRKQTTGPGISYLKRRSKAATTHSQPVELELLSSCGTSTTSIQIQGSPLKNPETQDSSEQWRIETIAALALNHLPLSCLELDSAYMMTEAIHNNGEEKEMLPMQKQHLGALVKGLAQRNQILAVSISLSNTTASTVAILQPLTSISATLTPLKANLTSLLNKAFLSCATDFTMRTKKDEKAECFVKEKCPSLMEQLALDSIFLSTENPSRSTPVPLAEKFNPNFFSDFFLTEAKSQQQDKVMGLLRENDAYKSERESEMSRVRALKQHYLHQKTQRRPHLVDPPNSSANHSSETISLTPSPTPRSQSSKHRSRKTPLKQRASSLGRKHHGKLKAGLHSGYTPRKNTPRKRTSAAGFRRRPGPSPSNKFSQALKRVRSSTGPTRSDLIFRKSKEARAKQQEEEVEGVARKETKKKSVAKPKLMEFTEFKSEEELLTFVRTRYDDIVSGENESSVVTQCQTIVNLALHFHKQAQEITAKFLLDNILLTAKALRKKYSKAEENKENKVREFELQAVLYMEVSSLQLQLLDKELIETRSAQVAGILTSLIFIRDESKFLQEVILDGYSDTVPHLLISIYNEMGRPLPSQIAALAVGEEEESTKTPAPASVNQPGSSRSDLSSTTGSMFPPSDRSLRERKQHSFTSFKFEPKRQISVAVPSKAKVKKPVRSSARLSGRKVNKSATKPSTVVRAVCRNLFDNGASQQTDKIERRQSVAVMESAPLASPLPSTPPRKERTSAKVLAAGGITPKGHHTLKTRTVAETPHHKQKMNTVRRRQAKERKRASITSSATASASLPPLPRNASEISVIEDSPEKALKKDVFSPSPVKRRASLQLTRHSSFYSSGPTCLSRSTLNYEKLEHGAETVQLGPNQDGSVVGKLEERLRGNCLLSPGWNEKIYRPGDLASKTTPRRIKPQNLFGLLKSPSPNKTVRDLTSGKRKRVQEALNFDTPSKRTRARSVFLSPEIERPVVRRVDLMNVEERGVKRMRDDTPIPNNSVLNTPPKREGLGTPTKLATFSTPKRSLYKQVTTPHTNTPRKGKLGSSSAKRHMREQLTSQGMNQMNQMNQMNTESQGFDSPGYIMMSPARSTRSQTASGNKARTNLAVFFSPEKKGTPQRKDFELLPTEGSFGFSPFKEASKIGMKLSQEHTDEKDDNGINPFANAKLTVSTNRTSRSPSPSSPVFKTPPASTRSKRRRSRSPSPLLSPDMISQWPRRKSRAAMNRSPSPTSNSKSSSSGTESNLEAPCEIHRRIRPGSSKSPALSQESVKEHERTKRLDGINEELTVTPPEEPAAKRRRIMRSGVHSSSNNSLNEVFLMNENACDAPSENDGGKDSSPLGSSVPTGPEESLGFNLTAHIGIDSPQKKIVSFESFGSNSNVPDSPIFLSPVANRKLPQGNAETPQSMKANEKPTTSDESDPPASPVFNKTSIDEENKKDSDEENRSASLAEPVRPSPRKAALASPFSPLKKNIVNPPTKLSETKQSPFDLTKSPKTNFSPLSSKGLLTLMESPLLSTPTTTSASKGEGKEPKSKKMLYR